MPEFVTLECSDAHPGVGTILLHRPPMNALSRQVQAELAAAAEEATVRADIKAVVVYGGPKILAAGADVKEMRDVGYAEMSRVAGRLQIDLGAIAGDAFDRVILTLLTVLALKLLWDAL